MWSHFTDLAIKAQKDLQEQAQEAAQALQHTAPPGVVSSFFNLDSMQQPTSNQKTESAVTESDTVTISEKDDHSYRTESEDTKDTPQTTPQPISSSEDNSCPTDHPQETHPLTLDSSTDPHVADVTTTDDAATVSAVDDSLLPTTEASPPKMVPPTVVADDDDDDSSSSVVLHPPPVDAVLPSMPDPDAAVTPEGASLTPDSDANESNVEENPMVPAVASDSEVVVEMAPPNSQETDQGDEKSLTVPHSTHVGLVMSPSPSKPRWTKKLLILISTNSIDRQVKVRQDLVQTALVAAGIDFECLDGSAATDESVVLRNELFALSGLRGVYPQFFLVDLIHGGTTFWGTFTEFQHANDDGQLSEAFGSNMALQNRVDPPLSTTLADTDGHRRDLTQPPTTVAVGIPDEVLEGFSNQIKRIEENHQIERDEIESRHKMEIEKLNEMYNAIIQSKKELEDRFHSEIKIKEEQLTEALRRNEGHLLKMDVLKREVSGTQELLQARELEIKKLNEKHLHDLRAIEKQGVVAERKAEKLEEELNKIQSATQTTQGEMNSLKEDHEKLLQRTKSIAAELKDRRAECRHMESLVDQETQKNSVLQQTIDLLEERLNHQGMSQTEKDGEMEQLRSQLAAAKLEMEQVEKKWREKEAKSEMILAEYKKRAQHSLSMANSRTASAVQAREEAELDARSARSTADSALERATKAEISSREAVAEAKTRIEAMLKERDAAISSSNLLKDEMNSFESKLASVQHELENVRMAKEKNDMEVERLRKELDESETKIISAKQKMIESTNLVDTLREEVGLLRDQLQHATIQAVDVASANEKKNDDLDTRTFKFNGSHDEGDEHSMAALRSELNEANDAIEDLKAALKNALEQNEQKLDTQSNHVSTSNESIPLFYAMEKQAELKTARAEMNRLASVIADVQSEKMEAYEAMEDMRRKMEDAEARLKRFEKLGSLPTSETRMTTDHEISTAVNIEYLKHIMLRFMNAKSLPEKKTLVPVIAAVLELTPDEVQKAMHSVEHNPSGASGSKLFGFM